jgi:hypothetical protein
MPAKADIQNGQGRLKKPGFPRIEVRGRLIGGRNDRIRISALGNVPCPIIIAFWDSTNSFCKIRKKNCPIELKGSSAHMTRGLARLHDFHLYLFILDRRHSTPYTSPILDVSNRGHGDRRYGII